LICPFTPVFILPSISHDNLLWSDESTSDSLEGFLIIIIIIIIKSLFILIKKKFSQLHRLAGINR
jgi:hypothetical protein